MTRQEKEQAILAECERVTKGQYDTPIDSGLLVITLFKAVDGDMFSISRRKCQYSSFMRDGSEKSYIWGDYTREDAIDNIYAWMGLETRALEEEIKRLRDGYLSVMVMAYNAFKETEHQAFARGVHCKSVRKWTDEKTRLHDEFLGKIMEAQEKFNALLDSLINPPTP